jgi:PAS domain S-box-containing protein
MSEVGSNPPSEKDAIDFLPSGGEMAALIRAKDWSLTPLGPVATWPQSLRTAASLCLASNFPINLIWGAESTQIYNDGYRVVCGDAHPRALGEGYDVTWASAWPAIGAPFERARAGATSYIENQQMFLTRNGYWEETFFTFSLSPIRNESGIGGLFHPVTETTAAMLSERRTRALRDLASSLGGATNLAELASKTIDVVTAFELDLPFALVYQLDPTSQRYHLGASCGIAPDAPGVPAEIDPEALAPWPFADVIRAHRILEVCDARAIFAGARCGPYDETPNTAFLMPIEASGADRPPLIVVIGASPRLPLNEAYRGFYEMLATTISAAHGVASAREHERRRAEALAEIDRAKTTFFSNASHELRTPLTLILGPIEDELSELGDQPPARRERLEIARRNALRLRKLVNALLDFSRIEAGRMTANLRSTELAAATADLASNFRSACESAGLALVVDCQPLSRLVAVDRDMWEKIVLNLISNAFKATVTGRIEVSLRQTDTGVELRVSDTGVGIPAHDLPHVFERFHRVDGQRGRTSEGTGIGLSLVRELVALHDGAISVESTEGEGTTLRVTLPFGAAAVLSDPAPETGGSTRAVVPANAFVEEALRWLPDRVASNEESSCPDTTSQDHAVKPRVILVDDNADMRNYIRRVLESAGYEVEAAANGLAALAAARAEPRPDIVLSDVMMPELDGFGMLRALRADPALKDLPVIMLSARAGEEARIEGLAAGADDYMVKPFAARELCARIDGAIKLANQRRGTVERIEQQAAGLRTSRDELQQRVRERTSDLEKETAERERLAAIVEFSEDAIIGKTLDGVITSWNRGAAELFGFTAAEAVGQSMFMIVPARLRDERDLIEQIRRHERANHLETRRRKKDGGEVDVSVKISPIRDATGEIVGESEIARDITDLKVRDAELMRSNAALEQYAYVASHDLQEPLRMVAVFTELLAQRYRGKLDETADQYIDFAADGARRMQTLVADLLSYSKVGSQGKPLAPVDASRVLDIVVDSLGLLIKDSGATVEYAPLPLVMADEVQLRQLLQNLVANAIKFRSQAPPRIIVEAAPRDGKWMFSVADNGIGLDMRHAERIFQMFQRLHERGAVDGSGIGLAIAKRIAERHGGRIWVESRPGAGTTFFFTIPMVSENYSAGSTRLPAA